MITYLKSIEGSFSNAGFLESIILPHILIKYELGSMITKIWAEIMEEQIKESIIQGKYPMENLKS